MSLACRRPPPPDGLDRAARAAAGCDLAIVIVGTSDLVESEGYDRRRLALPDDQDALIARVIEANQRTVVVVNSGGHLPTPDWLYTETITPPCALWIAGSGHIAQAVAPIALQLDFAVSVFDDRSELANHDIFPREANLQVGPWGELCAAPFPDVPTFGLIVTRGHKHDALVLETWIHRPFAFLGMMGSTRKARTIAEHFIAKKIATPEEMQRVACPVGVRIRSRSVMEIAVDILAQYIDKRAEAIFAPLRATAATVELVG
jgi:xanthine/CO dehydrogenase XdhC/CoxF family maturation factor